jgi:4-carboxymuconolactone decarboxylase
LDLEGGYLVKIVGARLAPAAVDDLDDEMRELLEVPKRPVVPNILITLARHPSLFKSWKVFRNHILEDNSLSPRDRELIILRACWRCGSAYGWGHHAPTAERIGLSKEEIRGTTIGLDGPNPLAIADRLLLRAVDELLDEHEISDSTWQALAERYDDRQLLDLLFTAGQYTTMSTVMRSLRVDLEPGVWPFPTQ